VLCGPLACRVVCRYVRLELLEGVVAFHSGEQQTAQQRLQCAHARWQRLQVGLASAILGAIAVCHMASVCMHTRGDPVSKYTVL